MFLRYESFRQFIRLYPIITGIVALHIILFLISLLLPSMYWTYVFQWGVGHNDSVTAGQWWRLVTPIFLHAGFSHFILNSFSLVIFGPALERMLGRLTFFTAYLLAGIAGNLGTLMLESDNYVHLGASGAIYGLLGIYFYLKLYRKDLIDSHSAQVITIFLVLGLIYSFMPNVNFLGHLFGFFGGFIIGSILFNRKRRN